MKINKEKIKSKLKEHLVTSSAMISTSTPIAVATELYFAGMPIEDSLKARTISISLTLAGLGTIIPKIRDKLRGEFEVNGKTKKKIQSLHDSAYSFTYNLLAPLALYYMAGLRGKEDLTLGTLGGIIYGTAVGFLGCYSIDIFKDLYGIEESIRVPKYIKNKTSKFKKNLVTYLTAASIATAGLIYATAPSETYTTKPREIYHSIEKSLESKLEYNQK